MWNEKTTKTVKIVSDTPPCLFEKGFGSVPLPRLTNQENLLAGELLIAFPLYHSSWFPFRSLGEIWSRVSKFERIRVLFALPRSNILVPLAYRMF